MSTFTFSLEGCPYPLQVDSLKIGIVATFWNETIVEKLTRSAEASLRENGIQEAQITKLLVPGAVELPTAAQWQFDNGCDAVICLGCVIRGETPHFEYVSQFVTQGILQVGLKANKPCVFGVLTVNDLQQALDRTGGIAGDKGKEAAETALWMVALAQKCKI